MKVKNLTIAAIATGLSRSPIGIIRISGSNTFEIIAKIFSFKNKNKNITNISNASISLGTIHNTSNIIDEALLSIFKSPDSYTGEDMAELSCHGNPLIMRKIMETLIINGANLAFPGDFTRRAFLNGKMDLTKAEAVSDIVSARTEAALKISVNQLFGAEKIVIEDLRNGIIELLAMLEADIDFEQDDVTSNLLALTSSFEAIIISITNFIKSAEKGLLIKEGAKVTITGRPNAGKSSLLNALTGFNRAIVTDIPGTTRDTIEETIIIDNIPVILTDTAGIRQASNPIEEEGIKRAKVAIVSADVVIFTMDVSSPITNEDKLLYAEILNKPHIIVLNKTDMTKAFDATSLTSILKAEAPIISVSALKNENINNLTKTIKAIIIKSKDLNDENEPAISALRHKTALDSALKDIAEGLLCINNNSSYETAAEHVKAAAASVSLITGEIATEDVLDKIFSNFCIGK
ncbi:MAG: tRNA uridine-5-carboxymethylaminomethyl(34) synthesis GTPase MnmE [bacterium]